VREARGLGEDLLGLARIKNDSALLVEAHRALCGSAFFVGDLPAARAHAEQGVALYRSQEHRTLAWRHGQDAGVACLSWGALALWHLGYADRALSSASQSVTLARELAQAHAEAMALYALALVHQLRRDAATARVQAEAAVQLSIDAGFPLYESFGRGVYGWALVVQGRPDEGIEEMERGLRAAEAIGVEMYRVYFLARLAEAHASVGQADGGRRILRMALETMERNEERVWEAELHRLQGDLALREADVEGGMTRHREATAAEACYRRAIDVARHQEARALELRAATSLGGLCLRQGRRAEARDLVEPVYAWFTEGFETPDLREARQLAETLA
jgi:adenylate cyclase